ncbi:MAG: hypothetical protein WBA08_14700, partial [Candidatus Sulfotelmatobacter sp.]
MNRRNFISSVMGAAVAQSLAARASVVPNQLNLGAMEIAGSRTVQSRTLVLDRHRFGVNYTPSKNWWFCWNEWD